MWFDPRALPKLQPEAPATPATLQLSKTPGSDGDQQLRKVAAVAVPTIPEDMASVAPYRRWKVHLPTLDPMEVIFTPPATRAEGVAHYPGATCEPLRERVGRRPTRSEEAELRALIPLVFADALEEHAAINTCALADPEDALRSFRALAVANCQTLERQRKP